MSAFSLDATTPLELKKASERELAITWKDGHQSLYNFRDLRGACQCASCVDERTGLRMFAPENVAEDLRLTGASPVGRYGIQFQWSDGHSTGIYAFDYLRSLCLCPACQATGPGEPD